MTLPCSADEAASEEMKEDMEDANEEMEVTVPSHKDDDIDDGGFLLLCATCI